METAYNVHYYKMRSYGHQEICKKRCKKNIIFSFFAITSFLFLSELTFASNSIVDELEEKAKAQQQSGTYDAGLKSQNVALNLPGSEEGFGFYSKQHVPLIPDASLPSPGLQPPKPHKIEKSPEIRKVISINSLIKDYKIPAEELDKMRPVRDIINRKWKYAIEEASQIESRYKITPEIVAFLAQKNNGRLNAYYDITLNFEINIPESYVRYKFLPMEFLIQVQPVRFNLESNQWEVIQGIEGIDVWQYSPEKQDSGAEITSSKGYTCTALANIGVAASPMTGGVSGNASAGASFSYSSTFTRKQTIPHVEITPMKMSEEVQWKITFNNLHLEREKGFLPTGVRKYSDLRWIWEIDHKVAKKQFYSKRKKKENIFYFKINSFVRYAFLGPKVKANTDFLPVFDSNNSELNQIIGIIYNPNMKYKITREVKNLDNAGTISI